MLEGESISTSTHGIQAFLLFENLDQSTWSKTLSDSRSAYSSLREHFLRTIEHPDELESAIDPLAEDDKSPWITLRQDEALRAEIDLDVERCMPDNLYFREPSTQKMMLDILFIFCKLNHDIGYRQGMHELLAPVLWVVERDAINPESEKNYVGPRGLSSELLDANYIEHDAFTLFSLIMQTAKSFYEIGDHEQMSTATATGQHATSQNQSPIVERSRRIHEEFLSRADPELADWMTKSDVLPQVFLIRWIRLLFGREFPFDDLLALWDALFAEDPALNLVDLICVAMLLRIRWQLIEADYSIALTLLLHYPLPPTPYGAPTFVQDALYLRNNLLLDGGVHIISKYSRKAPVPYPQNARPNAAQLIKAPSPSQATMGEQRQHSIARSPLTVPANFLRHQGGIEGILQDAAKGVYSQGEKWGVARAVRNAVGEVRKNVQVLQSNSGSPQRNVTKETRIHEQGGNQVVPRITALEDRNRYLAKLLRNAIEGLSAQQKQMTQDAPEGGSVAEALSLAIAKVQFVQVYLEDSMLPLPTSESLDFSDRFASPEQQDPILSNEQLPVEQPVPSRTTQPAILASEVPSQISPSLVVGPAHTASSHDGDPMDAPRSLETSPQAKNSNKHAGPSPFHRPRPSLAQSSFSWMLGEDQRQSSFVAPSPLPPDKRRESGVRGKSGFLFGDKTDESNGRPTPVGKKSDAVEEEIFTLGTLRKGKPSGE
ncbi:MAG: hypothetical protein M1827_006814 [Pycnora praestabilis]|nr:MAG: hypothetical protein M1827_006814 [Pycnora praestabilis]